MLVDLDRYDLERLVKSICIDYLDFGHELVLKAGHSYSEPYGRTYWDNLENLQPLEAVINISKGNRYVSS